MLPILIILIILYAVLYFIGLPYEVAPLSFYIINSIVYFVLSVWYLCRYKKKNIICFELLFCISYWLCCFFAVFVLNDIDNIVVSKQLMNFNQMMLLRSCNLCMLGYLFYMLGLCIKRRKDTDVVDFVIKQNPTVNTLLNYITFFFIALFFVQGGYNFYYSYDQTLTVDVLNGERFGNFGFALNHAILFLNITTISNLFTIEKKRYNGFWQLLKNINKVYLCNMLIMTVFLMACGYRSGVMQILIPFFVVLSMKQVIGTKSSVLIVVTGCVLLALLGLFRSRISSVEMVEEEMSIAMFFRDFLSANSAVPSLIEYVDIHGSANFCNAIPQIMAAVPFLQSIVLGAFGTDWLSISSSDLYTNEISRSFYSGMGTNIIGDLYYTGGFLCVIVLMFLLGHIVKRVSESTSKYYLVAMACIVGNAVFMPRVEYFYIVRSCGLAIIVYWVVTFIFPSVSVRKNE